MAHNFRKTHAVRQVLCPDADLLLREVDFHSGLTVLQMLYLFPSCVVNLLCLCSNTTFETGVWRASSCRENCRASLAVFYTVVGRRRSSRSRCLNPPSQLCLHCGFAICLDIRQYLAHRGLKVRPVERLIQHTHSSCTQFTSQIASLIMVTNGKFALFALIPAFLASTCREFLSLVLVHARLAMYEYYQTLLPTAPTSPPTSPVACS